MAKTHGGEEEGFLSGGLQIEEMLMIQIDTFQERMVTHTGMT